MPKNSLKEFNYILTVTLFHEVMLSLSLQDSWKSVFNIMNHYGKIQDTLIPAAGPGHFNDPDMVSSKI